MIPVDGGLCDGLKITNCGGKKDKNAIERCCVPTPKQVRQSCAWDEWATERRKMHLRLVSERGRRERRERCVR